MSEIKIVCYGVRPTEKPLFEQLNKYNYTLTLLEELLTEDNIDTVKNHQAVLLRGNCNAKAKNLLKMKEYGVEYLLTRTVGYDHIDVPKAKELGFKIARVPRYSPNAISELALSLALMLVRHTADIVGETMHNNNFKVKPSYFSAELRNLTVGIIGVGYIGATSARLFKGIGAKVIGYDPYPSEDAKALIEFKPTIAELLQQADVVSLHLPYLKNENYHFFDASLLQQMKSGAFLINTARGELVDIDAVLTAVESDKLSGYAADVLENETAYFNKDWSNKLTDPLLQRIKALYPRVLLTPHVGSSTDEACKNMVEQSFENLNDYLVTGQCKNTL